MACAALLTMRTGYGGVTIGGAVANLQRACRLSSFSLSDRGKQLGLVLRKKFERFITFRGQDRHRRSFREALGIDLDRAALHLSSGSQYDGILALHRKAVQRLIAGDRDESKNICTLTFPLAPQQWPAMARRSRQQSSWARR
jgi:hypothetical protein